MSLSLKFGLLNISTLEDINKLCSNKKDLCIKNRELLCKKTLELSGYKLSKKYNPCEIFKDLLFFARKAKNSVYKDSNILVISPNLIRIISLTEGYINLKNFMNENIKNKEDKILIQPTSMNLNRPMSLASLVAIDQIIKDLSTVKI